MDKNMEKRVTVTTDPELQTVMRDVLLKVDEFLYNEVKSHKELKEFEQFVIQYEVSRALYTKIQKDARKYNFVRKKIEEKDAKI